MARGRSESLQQRIRGDLDFLFSREGAAFRNCATDPRGNVEAEVAAGNVVFQFAWNTRDAKTR